MDIRQSDKVGKFAYVVHNQICVGFLIARGPAGVESFDRSERSLGVFADENAAVAAIFKSATGASATGAS
jgi:hypothetical protein